MRKVTSYITRAIIALIEANSKLLFSKGSSKTTSIITMSAAVYVAIMIVASIISK